MPRIFRYLPMALFFLCLPLAGQDAPAKSSVGLPVDWSFRHLIHSGEWTSAAEAAARREPRLVYQRLARRQSSSLAASALSKASSPQHKKSTSKVDWNLTLGAGKVAFGMSPAKFTFDVSASPNCVTDYALFALDVEGSSSQPNLVQLNNLYSVSGGTGFCSGQNGPTVLSAYNITTVATGKVLTSPSLAMDGTRTAFIETVTGSANTCPGLGSASTCSIFHVLTFGTTGSNGSFSVPTNTYTSAVPGTNNNAAMTSVTFSSATTTFSSPWVDYHNDAAYFGDDNGILYKTTCVYFCGAGTPAIAANWPIPVAAAGVKLGPPVMDTTSNKIFVGGSDGKLYMVDLSICPASCAVGPRPSVTVGAATTFGGIVDAPLIDTTFETVFAFAGDSGGGTGVIRETDTALSLNVSVNMGTAAFNVYDGAFDNAYYGNTVGSATANGHLFACGAFASNGQPAMYTIPFTIPSGTLSTSNPPRMNGSASRNLFAALTNGCSPLMEFMNGATDRLFFSQPAVPSNKCTGAATAGGCMFMYDITTITGGNIPSSPAASATENTSTSGIIIDNTSAGTQASSIYFTNQGTGTCTIAPASTPAYCAIKLTQGGLL